MFPRPLEKNGQQTGEKLPKAEKAFKGWNQESYRTTEQDIIALPPWDKPNIMGAFHLGKNPGNFGGSKSGISDW